MINKIDDVISLIKAVSDSNLESFEYKEGDAVITIKGKSLASEQVVTVIPEAGVQAPVVIEASPVQAVQAAPSTTVELAPSEPEGNVIKSPLVGVFYSAPAAGEKPFVKIGTHVKKGQVLAIIEAMKMMNEIESEYDGVVTNIFCSNEQSVEYGQPLFEIK